jgi:hypothetical protein
MKSRATWRRVACSDVPVESRMRRQRVRLPGRRRMTRQTAQSSSMKGGNGWPSSMLTVVEYSMIKPAPESVGVLRGLTNRACGQWRRGGVLTMAHLTTLAPVARGGAPGLVIFQSDD